MRCSALLLAVFLAACGSDVPPRAENVLLITVDTLRADHVGVYGAVNPTPWIDRLAEDGVVVRQFCTPTPTTAPAHVSLLTGLHPWNHGTLSNMYPFRDGLPSVAEIARAAGLETAAFVSSYVLHQKFGYARGFDTYHFDAASAVGEDPTFADSWTRGAKTTDAALAWLDARAAGGRFFLWVHYFDPHKPYLPPARFAQPPDQPVDMRGKSVANMARKDLRALILRYRGEVAYADAQIGRLMRKLEELDLVDTTAVVLTSDHGEGLGDHGHLQHSVNLYDELVHIPLVVRAPGLGTGLGAGRVIEGPGQLEDLMPTVLTLLGLEAPAALDGLDLLPWLSGASDTSPRRAVLGQRAPLGEDELLFYERAWPEKWIGGLDAGGKRYALEQDPRESVGTPATAPERVRAALERARKQPGTPAVDAETQRRMKALGYTD